ncbi:ras guanine nucleotide exchange factor domain-containing protein [Mycena crocata]|nr:ras guanine nucleotide exchange factor domain-containing protein [Mycena crocata]
MQSSITEEFDAKVSDWAALGSLRSFLGRHDIKQGIRGFLSNINSVSLEHNVPTWDYNYPQTLEQGDIRHLLRVIVEDTAEVQLLLSMQSEQPLDDIMQTLQTELHDPHMDDSTRDSFIRTLRLLREQRNKRPSAAARTKLSGSDTSSTPSPTLSSKSSKLGGSPFLKKSKFFFRRPSSADGSRSKPSREQLHLRVPSTAAPSPRPRSPVTDVDLISSRRPSSTGASSSFQLSPTSPSSSHSNELKRMYISSDDLSTPTLLHDTDSDLQSARSGSSLYSLPDSLMLLKTTHTGDVLAGNLEGLVDRLLTPDSFKHSEFQEAVFSTCHDFTTPVILLALIIRRFHEAIHDSEAIQLNVFTTLAFWMSNSRLPVHPNLSSHIKQFCFSVLAEKTSLMHDNARNLLRLAGERATVDIKPSSVTPSSTKIPRTADILPRDLAIALTLLEGDRYGSIRPADYLSHLRKIDMEGPNNVDAASTENNKIILWVKKSVLTPSRVETRAEVLKFFVNTAHECHRLRNFESLSAIANALQSTPIERLTLTVGALSPHLQTMLQDLKNLLDPSNNHLTYRAALNPEEALDYHYRDFCIPWLAVHLRDLYSLLKNYPPKVEIDGLELLNFRRYSSFMEHVRGINLFKPPDLERYRLNGQLAYLQHQLRGVHFDPDSDVALMERSLELEADETRMHRTRALELKRLGFRAS